MQLKCPACNAGFSLEAALGVDSGRAALHAALQMPALGGLLAQYLGMFRAAGRALAFDRAEKLLIELKPMLDGQFVVRNELRRPCSHELWQQALERMIEHRNIGKLNLPLKSHGYLLEVAFALADSAGAKAERETEESRRRGDGRKQASQRMEGMQIISRARGDVALGLVTREQARQQLREAGINPESLDG